MIGQFDRQPWNKALLVSQFDRRIRKYACHELFEVITIRDSFHPLTKFYLSLDHASP